MLQKCKIFSICKIKLYTHDRFETRFVIRNQTIFLNQTVKKNAKAYKSLPYLHNTTSK